MLAKSTILRNLHKQTPASNLIFVIIILFSLYGCTPVNNPDYMENNDNSSPIDDSTINNQDQSIQSETQLSEEEPMPFDGIENTSMFDGQHLGYWVQSPFLEEFYEQGDVYIEDGCIVLKQCDWMTGIKWTGPYQTSNYRMYFEAMRTEGDDFFCTLTFPVGDSFCSLVIGGWANQVTGISTINNRSANENESSQYFSLLDNVWYRVYLEVTDASIQAWIDEVPLFRVNRTEDKIIDVRSECEPSVPLGFATYMSTGVIRNIYYYVL